MSRDTRGGIDRWDENERSNSKCGVRVRQTIVTRATARIWGEAFLEGRPTADRGSDPKTRQHLSPWSLACHHHRPQRVPSSQIGHYPPTWNKYSQSLWVYPGGMDLHAAVSLSSLSLRCSLKCGWLRGRGKRSGCPGRVGLSDAFSG